MAVVSSLRAVNGFYLFLSLCKKSDKQVRNKIHRIKKQKEKDSERLKGCSKVTKTPSFGSQPDKPVGVSSVLPVLDAQQRT